MVTADDGSVVESKSFEVFWQDSCSFYGNCAVLSFYAGSFALYYSNLTFLWYHNIFVYDSILGGEVCVYVILLSLLITITLLIYIRYFEKISMDNSNNGDDEDETFSWGAFGSNSSKPPGSLKSSMSLQRLSQYFTSDCDNEQGDADKILQI
jgi:hypothetical protein